MSERYRAIYRNETVHGCPLIDADEVVVVGKRISDIGRRGIAESSPGDISEQFSHRLLRPHPRLTLRKAQSPRKVQTHFSCNSNSYEGVTTGLICIRTSFINSAGVPNHGAESCKVGLESSRTHIRSWHTRLTALHLLQLNLVFTAVCSNIVLQRSVIYPLSIR